MQLEITEAQVQIFKDRIDKYLQVAKQAKSVLRIPRLCTMYHAKIKGLSDQESNQLLEKIYNDWYIATREARKQKMAAADGSSLAGKSLDITQTSAMFSPSDTRPLSKIEETLMDRSITQGRSTGNPSKLSNKVKTRSSVEHDITVTSASVHEGPVTVRTSGVPDPVFQS